MSVSRGALRPLNPPGTLVEKGSQSQGKTNRKRLQKILRDGKATKILVEHKDRLTRFGFNYLKTLLANQGCEIEVVNESKEDKKELMDDLIAIITSFCARYYGLRRSKRKIEKIIEELKRDD